MPTVVRKVCSPRPAAVRSASCVRGTRPGLDRVLAHLLAPFVLVDGGWTAALDLALAAPGVIAVTREGDRFGGASPWRAGPPGSSVVTPAALAEAEAAAASAETARADAEHRVEQSRLALAAARRAELVAAERERARRTELDRLMARAAELRRDVEVRSASLEERQTTLRPKEEAQGLLERLRDGALTADELVRVSGIEPAAASAALMELELGMRVSLEDGVYRVSV